MNQVKICISEFVCECEPVVKQTEKDKKQKQKNQPFGLSNWVNAHFLFISVASTKIK